MLYLKISFPDSFQDGLVQLHYFLTILLKYTQLSADGMRDTFSGTEFIKLTGDSWIGGIVSVIVRKRVVLETTVVGYCIANLGGVEVIFRVRHWNFLSELRC